MFTCKQLLLLGTLTTFLASFMAVFSIQIFLFSTSKEFWESSGYTLTYILCVLWISMAAGGYICFALLHDFSATLTGSPVNEQ